MLSCFAVTPKWTPLRLAEGTNYRLFRSVSADTLLAAGFYLWPTNVYLDGVPDPRNEVHYDLVVTIATPEQVQATLTGGSAGRRAGREALAEPFRTLFNLLGEVREIEHRSPGQE